MGIDYVLFDRLCELSSRFRPEGRTLMLGRQGFSIQGKFAKRYEKSLAKYGLEGNRFDYLQEDGYCETLMQKLGFGEIETLDFSDYEGAGVLQDLNLPVIPALHNQFDFIFDGGTIEHVFNVPTALENMFHMLKPGGRLVSANGMNGWMGHGFYQFNPELVWTFWRRMARCNLIDCRGIKKTPVPKAQHMVFPDPAETGHRLRFKRDFPDGQVYLYYEVEKTHEARLGNIALQSDYETTWAPHATAGETNLGIGG